MSSPITTQLEQRFQHCNNVGRRTRIMTRWSDTPALAGHCPAAIIDVCRRADITQNPLVAALIARHQLGDDDATTVVMMAIKPVVIGIAHSRNAGRLTDDIVDGYWAAVGHMLSTVDPTIDPVDSAGRPVVYLTYLGNLITANQRRLDPTIRRWRMRRQRGCVEIPSSFDRDTDPTSAAPSGPVTRHEAIEDEAIARVELARITRIVTTGQIPSERWAELVAHRVVEHPDVVTPTRVRVAVYRTAARLSQLVDHAA